MKTPLFLLVIGVLAFASCATTNTSGEAMKVALPDDTTTEDVTPPTSSSSGGGGGSVGSGGVGGYGDNPGDLHTGMIVIGQPLAEPFASAGGCGGSSSGGVTCQKVIDSSDIFYLQDGEQIYVNDNFALETGLTIADPDQDFLDNVLVPVAKDTVRYVKQLDYEAVIAASLDEPYTVSMLGKELEIIGNFDSDTITVLLGETFHMNVGDSVIVNGSVVVLDNVGSTGNVQVTVGTESCVIVATGSTKCNGLRFTVKDFFYTEDPEFRSAVLIIGTETTKTVNHNDEYLGEFVDDPDWVWNIDINPGDATIGVDWDQTIDSPNDEGTLGRDVNKFCLPNDYVCFGLGDAESAQYQQITIKTISFDDLYPATGNTQLSIPGSPGLLEFVANNGTGVFGSGAFGMTNNIAVWYNESNDDTYWFQFDEDDNKYRLFRIIVNGANEVPFNISTGDIPVRVIHSGDGNLNVTIDEETATTSDFSDGFNLHYRFETDASGEYTYVGLDPDTAVAANILYGSTAIGNWEENTLTDWGIEVLNPDSYAPQKYIFVVPNTYYSQEVLVGRSACSDSDGGKTFGTKGTVTVNHPDGSTESSVDACANRNSLREYFCNTGAVDSLVKDCANGCAAGICKPASKPGKKPNVKA